MSFIDSSFRPNSSTTVLVATNEANKSSLLHLRTTGGPTGFLILSDLLEVFRLSNMDLFILETMFMLKSPSFLSFGVSSINDYVESERSLRGMSHCLIANDPDRNWCRWHVATSLHVKSSPIDFKFNWTKYLQKNSDLRHFTTESQVTRHWNLFGKKEGRSPDR